MFDLLNPLYFYIGGAAGVLIPLLLHLIQTRRTVRMPFSTIRFLLLAQKQSSRRIKMENLLLWIIRTLLLVVLALAFAMPLLRDKALGQWFGRSPRDVAIVIDGSYSMDYNLGRGTVWDKAIETATAVVEGLSEQDRLCVFVAREAVEPVIEQLSGDREEAIGRLKTLAFSQTSSRLAPAVMDAHAALAEAKERREREIHVITDTQALPWDSFGGETGAAPPARAAEGSAASGRGKARGETPAATNAAVNAAKAKEAAAIGVWDPDKLDKETVIFVSLLGAEAPENTSPVDVALEPSVIMAEAPSKATVRLAHTGPPRSTALTLYVNDEEAASRSLTPGAGPAEDLTFIIPPLPPGRHTARVELPDDNLAIDNAFHFLLKVEDQFPTLCVGSLDDTFFLRAALTAGLEGNAAFHSEWVDAGGLGDKTLDAYACIFLCNAVPMGAGEVAALERFVDGGGLLVFFPGERGSAADYQAWGCLPGVPVEVASIPLSRRKRMLSWDAPRHAILEPLKIGASTLAAAVRRQLVWTGLEPRAERLISHGGEYPFLIGGPRGRGYVLMFAVSADRTWSDFPLSPFYLPIIHQVVLFGAGVGLNTHYVWCTASLPLETYLPEATRDTRLQDPDGKTVPIRSAVVDARTFLHVEDVFQAGVYRMRDSSGEGWRPAFAVNMSREESNLAPLDPARVPGLLGLEHVNVARNREELMTQIQESRVGRTFGEPLLWVVLLLAALEFFYANYLSREQPALSAALGLEASGKVPAAAADRAGKAS